MPHKSSIIDTSEKSGYLRKVSQVEGPLDAAAGGPATAGRRGRRIGGRCGEGDSVVKDNAEARRIRHGGQAQRLAEVPRSFAG